MAVLFTSSGSSWNVTITEGVPVVSDDVSWVQMSDCVHEMGKNNNVSFHFHVPDSMVKVNEGGFEFQWDDIEWLKIVNISAWWESVPVYSETYEYALGKNWMVIPA